MKLFDELKQRGFIQQTTNEEIIRELFEKERVTCYVGFDPSAASLHVGHMLPIIGLAHMQRAGHRPIVLLGGGTGMVGDPTGKTEMRKLLNDEALQRHLAGIKDQFARFLSFENDAALILNNADWILPLNYIEFLRTIGVHFSVNRMLASEAYKQRLERGLNFIEFNYQILQAYDFLVLFQRHNCKLQFGGDDQWGNIVAGIDLIRRVESAEAQALTFPLLLTASGTKMGKTESGAIWIDKNLMTPFDFFQFWRNTTDDKVMTYINLFTFIPLDEIKELGELALSDINRVKERLAFEVTAMVHGREAAEHALEDACRLFKNENKELAANIPTITLSEERLNEGVRIIDLICESGLAPSKAESRKLIRGGGAYVNEDQIKDETTVISKDTFKKDCILIRCGKKRYAKIVMG